MRFPFFNPPFLFLWYNNHITGGILEEKLYFAPADYGKGAHKRKEKQENKKEGKNHRAIKLGGFLLFLAIIIVVIIWLLHGKTTTSGQYPENVRNESLTCVSNATTYEKTSDVNSDDKELKVSMVFNGTETLSSASLKYTLRFGSYSEAYSAEAISHAQFNLALQALGYDASKFNNKFSIMDNELVISLSANLDKSIDDATRSYFLIDYVKGDQLPRTITEYRANYEKQGFSCTSTIDQ